MCWGDLKFILDACISITWASWRGLAPWYSPIGLMPFHRAQKTLNFQCPTPYHLPSYWIWNNTYVGQKSHNCELNEWDHFQNQFQGIIKKSYDIWKLHNCDAIIDRFLQSFMLFLRKIMVVLQRVVSCVHTRRDQVKYAEEQRKFILKEDLAFSLSLELGQRWKKCAASVGRFSPSIPRGRGW